MPRDEIEIGGGEDGIARRRDSNRLVVVEISASIPRTSIRVVPYARIFVRVNLATRRPVASR